MASSNNNENSGGAWAAEALSEAKTEDPLPERSFMKWVISLMKVNKNWDIKKNRN